MSGCTRGAGLTACPCCGANAGEWCRNLGAGPAKEAWEWQAVVDECVEYVKFLAEIDSAMGRAARKILRGEDWTEPDFR